MGKPIVFLDTGFEHSRQNMQQMGFRVLTRGNFIKGGIIEATALTLTAVTDLPNISRKRSTDAANAPKDGGI